MNFFSGHYISCCGSNHEHIGWTDRVPLYYGIQYNHSGKLYLRINHEKEYRVEGSYAFVTHPHAYFEYGNINGEPRSHNFICSYGERIKSYIKSGLLEPDRDPALIRIANPEKFLQTMLAIIAMARRPGPLSPRAILLYEDLLLQMYESGQSEKKLPPYQELFFKKLIEDIRKHPEEEWDFEREAEKCNITTTHFRRLFKEITDLPPRQFLIQCRLQHAAHHLIFSHDSIGEIAEKVGIENQFYFSRLFREKYLTSPLEYRREFTGKAGIEEKEPSVC